jgi:hypothetical protein
MTNTKQPVRFIFDLAYVAPLEKQNESLKRELDIVKAQLEKCKEQRDDELDDNCWSEVIGGVETGRPFESVRASMELELESIRKEMSK